MSIEKFYDDKFVKSAVLEIARQMQIKNFSPDYVVGLSRGGLVPGVLLSHYLEIPFHALNKDDSNSFIFDDEYDGKKILIIDDINDTGETFKKVSTDEATIGLNYEYCGNNIKLISSSSIKYAALIHNEASAFESDFCGYTINKAENPEWCVFPWERWW